MHLEALTFLLHYCLLDTAQQNGFSVNQPTSSSLQTGVPGAKPVQIINNLVHVFMPNPLASDMVNVKDKASINEKLANARKMALNHLPRIIASLSALWEAVLASEDM